MTQRTRLYIAAAMALGTLGFSATPSLRAADPAQQPLQPAADVNGNHQALKAGQLPPGIQRTEKDDAEDIRQGLAKTAEGVFDKGDMGSLVANFVDADRNRLDKYFDQHKADQNYAKLIFQLKNDWKTKYGQDFDMKHEVVFGSGFKGLSIVQGEIANPTLLSNWPVANGNEPANAVQSGRRNMADVKGNEPGDRNLDKGRNVAVVTIPASHGMPEVIVSMIHELPDRWRIDVPDNVDGAKLQQNLVTQLTKFDQMKDQWPADVNEAYRMFSHSILMAVYDVNGSGNNALQGNGQLGQ